MEETAAGLDSTQDLAFSPSQLYFVNSSETSSGNSPRVISLIEKKGILLLDLVNSFMSVKESQSTVNRLVIEATKLNNASSPR